MRDPHRLRAGIYGALVGDALGVPYEFHAKEAIPPPSAIELTPPPGFSRAHAGTPPGTYSDDGAHLLCLLESLLERGGLDLEDLGRRLLAWYEEGHLAVDQRVFDCGIQTGQALRALRGGVPAERAGPAGVDANGNGSLMRVLPLALWHTGSDRELVELAARQSLVTHGHLRSQLCCGLACLWARRTLEGVADPFEAATRALREIVAGDAAAEAELEFHLRPDDAGPGGGSGYVVDCLRSARWAVSQGPYEVAVKAAIGLGRDTDTTACVAGGIAGLRDGLDAIPARWRQGLRGVDAVEALLSRWLGPA